MKNLMFLLMMTLGNLVSAQFVVEDVDDTEFLLENGRTLFSANMNFPLEHFRIKSCVGHISYAKPENGEDAFRQELFTNMLYFVDKDSYSLNGTFFFIFEISPNREISDFELKPTVRNSEMFFEDMKFVVKKLNTKWIPATCGGAPVSSKVRMKVNFKTDVFDL